MRLFWATAISINVVAIAYGPWWWVPFAVFAMVIALCNLVDS